jgi:glycosyltransferase involved in cell wall biosynthesis
MASPVISVIMPVYNAEKYVYEAIDSILKQTFADFEFLVFNDCSTDSSKEIILSFQDPRIRFIDSTVNTGYVKHLNEGLLQAKGQYIARMDADDVADPMRFLQQVQYLNENEEVAVCGSWIQFIGSQEGIVEYSVDHIDIVTHLFLFGNAMAHPAVMMRSEVIRKYQLSYEAALEPAEDYELWYRISSVAKLYNIPNVLLKYRMHDRNESVLKRSKQEQAVSQIRERIINDSFFRPERKLKSFILNHFPKDGMTDLELTTIRLNICQLLSSKKYNNRTIKIILTNRFIAWCKASNISGLSKMIQYIRFPKYFFSMRICLSLLLNK